MERSKRSTVLWLLSRAALVLVVSSFLAGSLLAMSDHAARAAQVANAATVTPGMCGGGCAEHSGGCPMMGGASKPTGTCPSHAQPAKATGTCPVAAAKAATNGHDCQGKDCAECDATCPKHKATTSTTHPKAGAAQAHNCQGKDCAHCDPACPDHHAARSPKSTTAAKSPKPAA